MSNRREQAALLVTEAVFMVTPSEAVRILLKALAGVIALTLKDGVPESVIVEDLAAILAADIPEARKAMRVQ